MHWCYWILIYCACGSITVFASRLLGYLEVKKDDGVKSYEIILFIFAIWPIVVFCFMPFDLAGRVKRRK